MLVHLIESSPSEKANHVRIGEILKSVSVAEVVRVPLVVLGVQGYVIESFDKSVPLYEESSWANMDPYSIELYIEELEDCLKSLGEYNIFLKGVEAYLQPDGYVILTNFSKVHHTRPASLFEGSFILPESLQLNGGVKN